MSHARAFLGSLGLLFGCLGPPAQYGAGAGGAGGEGGGAGSGGAGGGEAGGGAGGSSGPEVAWVQVLGDGGAQDIQGLAVGADFHVHLVGVWDGLAPADVAPAPLYGDCTGNAVFVAELDSFGEWLWARCLATGTPQAGDVDVDAQGRLAVAYSAGNTLDTPLGAIPTNGVDAAIALLDTDGALLWVRPVTGSQQQIAASVSFGYDGSLYAAGTFRSLADFGGEQHDAAPGEDLFYGALDLASGDFVWLQTIVTDAQASFSIRVAGPRTPSSPVGFGGRFGSTLSFSDGTSLASTGGVDAWFGAFDPQGTLLWARSAGSAGDDDLRCLGMGKTEMVLAGTFDGSLDLAGDGSALLSSPPGDTDAWLGAVSALTGEVSGVRAIGGAGFQSATACHETPLGILGAGLFSSEIDLDGVLSTSLASAGWLAGFSNAPALPVSFRLPLEGPGMQVIRAMDFHGADTFYVAGFFSVSLVLDGVEYPGEGSGDVFIAQLVP